MSNASRLEEGWFFHTHAWYTLHEILKNIKEFDDWEYNSVLDFGAGSGVCASVIQAVFPKLSVYCTDIDVECEDFWKERGLMGEISDFIIDGFLTMPKKYDVLVCNHVIEHLDFADIYLRKFSELAKRLILIVPDGDGKDDSHFQDFDRVSFKDLIDRCIEYKSLKIYPQYHPHINNLIAVVDI